MKTTINLRKTHEELLKDKTDTAKIFERHFKQSMHDLNILKGCLKGTDDEIILDPSDSSWLDYNMSVLHKGILFAVRKCYKDKLYVCAVKQISLHRAAFSYDKVEYPKYTYSKLNSKRLLHALDCEVKTLQNALKKYDEAKTRMNERWASAIAKLEKIADLTGYSISSSKYHLSIHLPLKRISVKKDEFTLEVTIDRDVDDLITLIEDAIKHKIKNQRS